MLFMRDFLINNQKQTVIGRNVGLDTARLMTLKQKTILSSFAGMLEINMTGAL